MHMDYIYIYSIIVLSFIIDISRGDDGYPCLSNCKPACDSYIPHGKVTSCVSATMCSYTCDSGYRPTQTGAICLGGRLAPLYDSSVGELCKTGDRYCPKKILAGTIDFTCNRKYGTYCSDYTCSRGYTKALSPPTLKCEPWGEWTWDRDNLGWPCFDIDTMCPASFTNGRVSPTCHRQPGAMCEYICDPGCAKRGTGYILICGIRGDWSRDLDSLCTDCGHMCPAKISRGNISESCDRLTTQSCEFTCDPGCHSTRATIYCESSEDWQDEDTACSCTDDKSSAGSSDSASSDSASSGMSTGVTVVLVIAAVLALIVLLVLCRKLGRTTKRKVPDTRADSQPLEQLTMYTSERPEPRVEPTAPPLMSITDNVLDGYAAVDGQSNNFTSQGNNSYNHSKEQYMHSESGFGPTSYASVPSSDPSLIPPPSYDEVTADPFKYKSS